MNTLHRWQRLLTHLRSLPLHARRHFPTSTRERIQTAIAASEQQHRGEIRFVVEHGLDLLDVWRGLSARDRAEDWFADLRIWDTADNTGVLIYVLLAEKNIEILADRGIHAQVPATFWNDVCDALRLDFQAGRYEAGVLAAIDRITRALAEHFPAQGHNPDELPDAPVVR